MGRIFLSHSSHNNPAAIAIRDWLEANGWDDVFLDLDPERGIAAGERWERRLYEAANRCEAVLFLISRSWLASDWCVREYDLAVKLNKRIFGLLIEDMPIAKLPAHISGTWQVVNLAEGEDHHTFRAVQPDGVEGHVTFSAGGLRRLKAGLERAGLDPRFFAWPPAGDPLRPPYRGLRPLEAEDAGIFFGREAPIIAALDQLRGLADAAPPRFLTILGASGSGKSSFLRAGLLPRLARDDRHFLTLPPIRPERQVISGDTGLLRALETVFRERGIARTRAALREAIERGASALLSLLAELAGNAALPEAETGTATIREVRLSIVLPIDQGEELFASAGREEASLFLPMLRDLLLATELPLIVLMTIRSDAFDSLQGEAALAEVPSVPFNLPPLPRGAYQLVIEGPAKRLEGGEQPLRIEPALTAALLNDIDEGGAKDALPLLAFTLERLYVEHGGDGDLRLPEYRHLGGIRGSIEAAVERALAAADRNPEIPRERVARLALLRRALIPWLAGIDPDTGSARRLVALLSEIPDESRPLVDLLVSERLLATDVSATGEETVEPAHEALLRQWGLLQSWLDEDRAALSTLESLRRSARDWSKNDRDAAWLVHQGGRLNDAEGLLTREDLSAKLESTDIDYLRTARAAETARRDRELEEARRYAEALRKTIEAQKSAIEAQRRAVRRTRIGIAAALVLTITAAGFGLYAREQKRAAEEQEQEAHTQLQLAQIAESRFLAREAEKAIASHSIPLAMELALAGLPKDYAESSNFDRPVVSESVSAVSSVIFVDKPRLILYHYGRETNSALSPDGTRVVTASDDGTAQIWDMATGAALGALMQHDGEIRSVAFSLDGARIVTASADGTASLWDAVTGAPLGVPMRHESLVTSATFSPDGTRIVTASSDGTARLWDATTGEPLGRPMRHWIFGNLKALVQSAAFSPDGTRVISISINGTARLWDSTTGLPLGSPMQHDSWVDHAAFSPDGGHIITTPSSSSSGGAARLWNALTGSPQSPSMLHSGVNSASFSPDGARIVTASRDTTARLWDAVTGTPLGAPMQHENWVRSAAFSPDGTLIVTTSFDDSVRFWDAVTGAPRGAPLWHEDVVSAAFAPGGKRIVTRSLVGEVRVWDVEVERGLGALLRHDGHVVSGDFSPDGTRFVTQLLGGIVQILDVKTGARIGEPIRHDSSVDRTIFSPDGRRIVTTVEGTARFWDLETGLSLGVPIRHGGERVSAVFSPDGTRIATVSSDGTARIWNSVTSAAIGAPLSHGAYINRVVFSPDGMRIAATTADNTVHVWEIAAGAVLGAPLLHDSEVLSSVFSPDGTHVVTASSDGKVWRWDVATGAVVGVPLRHDNAAESTVFSTDRMRIVTIDGGTARVWDLGTGLPLGAPLQHEDGVLSAAFSPDGTRVVTASHDRTAGVWDVITGARLASLKHDSNVYGAAFSPDGARIITWTYEGAMRIWDAPLPTDVLLPLARASQFRMLTEKERQAVYLAPRLVRALATLSKDATSCDLLASHPYDPVAKAPGVQIEALNTDEAILACEQDLERWPNAPRLHFLLGRALSKAGRHAEARDAFRIAVERGYAIAFQNLGIVLKDGDDIPPDLETARSMFAKAIEEKAYIAGGPLGSMYWKGEGGPVDKAQAVDLWQRAAAMGDPGSHESLGWVAELGRDGSTPDLPKALYHYAVAVKLLEAAGDETEAVAPRYRRASLARILDPYVVAAKWHEAMAFEAVR